MPINPAELTRSIGDLGNFDPDHNLAPTLQQVVTAAKQLFEADGAGLMLVDAEGQLRWASASNQTAEKAEDGQTAGPGPCTVAFSQRAPAAGRCGPECHRRQAPSAGQPTPATTTPTGAT